MQGPGEQESALPVVKGQTSVSDAEKPKEPKLYMQGSGEQEPACTGAGRAAAGSAQPLPPQAAQPRAAASGAHHTHRLR